MASIVGAALRGFGRALKRVKRGKGLRPSKTGAIRSVKPGVGGLKESRKMFESLQSSTAEGVRKFGREHTNFVLSKQKGKKSLPSIIRQSGDIERQRKKLGRSKGKK